MSTPTAPTLALRVNRDNPDHHLWENHGTWWCRYTVHGLGYTAEREAASLGTKDREEARRRRDALLAGLRGGDINPGGRAQ